MVLLDFQPQSDQTVRIKHFVACLRIFLDISSSAFLEVGKSMVEKRHNFLELQRVRAEEYMHQTGIFVSRDVLFLQIIADQHQPQLRGQQLHLELILLFADLSEPSQFVEDDLEVRKAQIILVLNMLLVELA
jgi:hypothetical protein